MSAREGCRTVSPPMRVALVIWSGSIGGAETQTASLAHHLRLRGLDARVLTLCSAAPLDQRLRQTEVPLIELGLARGTHVFRTPHGFIRAIRQIDPHVVILAQAATLAPVVRLAKRNAAIVHVEHTGLFWHSYSRRALEHAGDLCQAYLVDVGVAVSDFVLDAMSRKPHARLTKRIYNGVDVSEFRPYGLDRGGEQLTVGFAGRLGKGKGIEDLLHAASAVRSDRPFRMVLAGEGPCRREYEQLAMDLLGADRCRFFGRQTEMAAFWNSCDIAVVPTNGLVESFGMVAAEAMACGVPVIAARAGGLIEVVSHEEAGLLFDPGDRAELTAQLERYLSDSALRSSHGRSARRRVESMFDMRVTAADYDALCQDLRKLRE